PALGVDDLPSRGRQVDEPECLALRREGEVRPADDLQRPEAEGQEAEEGDRGEPDDPDADEEACAAVEVRGGDGNRADAETARDTDAAPAAPGVRDEIAQRMRSGSASGTSRPLRRTTWGTLCPVGTGAIAVRGAKDARFANVMPAELSCDWPWVRAGPLTRSAPVACSTGALRGQTAPRDGSPSLLPEASIARKVCRRQVSFVVKVLQICDFSHR